MAVSTLMAETDDVDAVYGLIVTECVRLLDVAAAGLVLSTPEGLLPVSAVGTSAATLVAQQQTTHEGPSVDVVGRGDELDVDLDDAGRRWPSWGTVARELGVTQVTSLPLCLVEGCAGALELHLAHGRRLGPQDLQVARSFAGVAVVVLHHDRELRRSKTRVHQLEGALQSRVVLEQAKGFLVAHGCGGPGEAFEAMRRFSRQAGRRLHAVAEDLLSGRIDPVSVCGELAGGGSAHTAPPFPRRAPG